VQNAVFFTVINRKKMTYIDSCCIDTSVHMQLTLPQESSTVRNWHNTANNMCDAKNTQFTKNF